MAVARFALAMVLGAVLLAADPPPEVLSPALAPLAADEWDADKAAHLLRRAGFGGLPGEIISLALRSPEEAVAFLVDYESRPATAPLVFEPFDVNHPQIAAMLDNLVRRRAREMFDAARARVILDLEEAMKHVPGQAPKPDFTPGARPGEDRRAARRDARERQPGESAEAFLWRRAREESIGNARQSWDQRNLGLLRAWWLAGRAGTARPLEEKMTLFWHGHFATGYETVRDARHMQLQNDTFRRHATGSFAALVKAVARDPAMLRYLDGNRNIKGSPNENFARELMELFTIGRGHYSEQDVKEAARAFTGWTYQGEAFELRERQHDDGVKTFMGRTGKLGGFDVIDTILAQDAVSTFIAAKLCRYFVGPTPDAGLVDGLARVMRASRYELKPVLRALFRSRAFYAPEVAFAHIKSPAELAVGAVRALELPGSVAGEAGRFMVSMGQELFQPPNVKGWDGGRAWINSSTLLVRYNFAAQLVANGPALIARAERESAMAGTMDGDDSERMAMDGAKLGKKGLTDAEKAAQKDAKRDERRDERRADRAVAPTVKWALVDTLVALETPEAIVDHLAQRLLGKRLDANQRAKLLAIANPPGSKFDPKDRASQQRLQAVAVMITSLPEYQLN